MSLPDVVHCDILPFTFKFPDASNVNVESYFKDKLLFVESINGFWIVKLFCFVVNKLFICNCALFENEFKLLNIVVDVAFKLLILNWALFEKLFKLLNIVVDVSFRFSIFKLEYVDKAFKLLVDVIFKLFKLVIILIPETVNEVQ